MGSLELLVMAVALSMDAVAVSICKGLCVRQLRIRHALAVGFWFGSFQALMPAIGYLLGVRFESAITSFDHWIAFGLLGILGVNMIRQARSDEQEMVAGSFSIAAMLPLAVATSIDALAVGVTFAFLRVQILPAISLIGVITCMLSALGLYIGYRFGSKYQSHAEMLGGCVLVLIGLKILLEHLTSISS